MLPRGMSLRKGLQLGLLRLPTHMYKRLVIKGLPHEIASKYYMRRDHGDQTMLFIFPEVEGAWVDTIMSYILSSYVS